METSMRLVEATRESQSNEELAFSFPYIEYPEIFIITFRSNNGQTFEMNDFASFKNMNVSLL